MRLLWFSLIVAACGGPSRHAHSIHVSAVSSDNHKCGSDAFRTGEVTPEGEPIRFWMPCWDYSKPAPRVRIPADPAIRAELARVEATQCIGLPAVVLERSPFAQADAIDEVIPRRDAGTIVGAYVMFKPVPGLTASWMRRAITCHRARWRALGKPHDYLAGDPTLVDNARVQAWDENHRVIVRIEADPRAGQLALSRAQALAPEQISRR